MADADPSPRRAGVPPPARLPEVDSPPRDDVLDGVPSTEEVVQRAQPAGEIVSEQPSVDELLGDDRDER